MEAVAGPERRRAVAFAIVLAVAAIHLFRIGTLLHGPLFRLYYGYASDVLVPLGMYFLLSLSGARLGPIRGWRARAVVVFGVASAAEILQGFGVPMLGRTFDPLDFVMFAVGVLVAVVLDRFALSPRGRAAAHDPGQPAAAGDDPRAFPAEGR